jgi:hypothetical protein
VVQCCNVSCSLSLFRFSGRKRLRWSSKAGGVCNGKPGERPEYTKGYYAAFVIDPLGNNVEAMYWDSLFMKAMMAVPTMFAGVLGAGIAVGLFKYLNW